MNYDYSKRGYLLPGGCKDLIDVQKLELKMFEQAWLELQEQRRPKPTPLPPVIGEVVIAEHTTVSQLAAILNQKPLQIIADLVEIGIIATGVGALDRKLNFGTSAKVARKHGYIAKRAA